MRKNFSDQFLKIVTKKKLYGILKKFNTQKLTHSEISKISIFSKFTKIDSHFKLHALNSFK